MSLSKEHALSPRELAELQLTVGTALNALALPDESAPHHVLAEIERYVKRWHGTLQAVGRFAALHRKDPETVAHALGVLWGHQLVRQFGWEWSRVHGDHGEHLSVVSPDRALALHPVSAIREALADFRHSLHAIRVYSLLEGGRTSALPPGCLEDVRREAALQG